MDYEALFIKQYMNNYFILEAHKLVKKYSNKKRENQTVRYVTFYA